VGKIIANLSEKKNRFFLLFFCLYQIIFLIQIHPQTILIQGKIIATRFPVKNASVIFIDNTDTTNKFSALSDASGNYQVNLNVTSVESGNSLPTKFELEQNYPNPFSLSTAIPYQIKKEADIQVTVYDILGRVVRKFNIGQQSAGLHNVLWDGRNNFGQTVASGIYFYKLSTEGESQFKKMIFNSNANGFGSLPHSYSLTKNSFSEKENIIQKIRGNTFTIRVENTNTTLPEIVPDELDNVAIHNDTTINFSVDYIPTVSIDFDSLHQIIRGFGATNLFFFGRPDMTNSEITTAFGTGEGQLGFTVLRLGIDADSSRWSMYVPTAKKAYDMGAKIIASPWYAPSNIVETANGVSRVRHDMYSEYAAHLNSFVTFMKNNGVPLYGVSVQNEPDITGNWTSWTADEMLTFMKENANAVEGTMVMDPESFHFNRTYSDPILNDSAANANTDVICGHIYGGGVASYPLAVKKGKEVWMTEYLINTDGNGPNMDTSWAAALLTAQSINGCMNAGMSAYVWWYIVRFYGPISDGTYVTKGEVTKKGYVMSQFARFIRTGFHRVESSVSLSIGKVSATAYKDPATSKVVIIAINSDSAQAESVFRMQNGAMTTAFIPYTTSETKNCEKGNEFVVTNGNFTYNLEPSSITTFVSN
jgi:glucuronoarabinoxylan endo-1,4-beta-xylanase